MNTLYYTCIASITFTLITKCCFPFWFYNIIKKNDQSEKGRWYVSVEKTQKKNQNSVIIMIPVVGKGAVFLVKLKLEGEIFE